MGANMARVLHTAWRAEMGVELGLEELGVTASHNGGGARLTKLRHHHELALAAAVFLPTDHELADVTRNRG